MAQESRSGRLLVRLAATAYDRRDEALELAASTRRNDRRRRYARALAIAVDDAAWLAYTHAAAGSWSTVRHVARAHWLTFHLRRLARA